MEVTEKHPSFTAPHKNKKIRLSNHEGLPKRPFWGADADGLMLVRLVGLEHSWSIYCWVRCFDRFSFLFSFVSARTSCMHQCCILSFSVCLVFDLPPTEVTGMTGAVCS